MLRIDWMKNEPSSERPVTEPPSLILSILLNPVILSIYS